jgi:hypothetical protein
MSDHKEDYLVSYDMMVALTDMLASLPYGQVFQIQHDIASLVNEQDKAREPKIILGETP